MDTSSRHQLKRNLSRALLLSFFQHFMLVMPIIVILFESKGVPLADVLLLQAWFAALVVVLEVPSGYVADLFGRRGAMLIGGLFLGIGSTWLVFAHGFWPIGTGPVFGYLGLGLLGAIAGIALCSVFFACRGFGAVILRDALNRRVSGRFRATANSLASFGFRAAFAMTAPLVGGALDLWGLKMTLLLLAAASFGIFVTLILPLILAVLRPRTGFDAATDPLPSS